MKTFCFADDDALAELCRRTHIRKLSLFGSTLSGSNRPDSDIDLLVEFEPGKEPGLIGLSGIELELSELLGRRKVDLRTWNELSRYFRDDVEAATLFQAPYSAAEKLAIAEWAQAMTPPGPPIDAVALIREDRDR